MSIEKNIFVAFCFATLAAAGPLEFGKAELNRALAARKLDPSLFHIQTEISADPVESYRIDGPRIFGGDIRGLMYGLLEAAEQIKATGKLSPAKGSPASPIRGIRAFYQVRTNDQWQEYIRMLAINRFNRVNLVFTDPPAIDILDHISQSAADHGIDFTLTLTGIPPNLGAILIRCKGIRGIQIQTDAAAVLPAIQQAGRMIVVEAASLSSIAGAVPLHVAPKRIFSPNGKLLWGDPDYLRRNVESNGFEIELPREFERHWMAYTLWGRLSYDPQTSDIIWMTELQHRYGAAAQDVMEAYRNTTVQAPVPSRFVESLQEAIRNRIHGIASGEITPIAMAVHLQRLALNLEQAVERIKKSIGPSDVESDFLTLANFAKYEVRMQVAADQMECFEQTGADSALYAAQRELRAAVRQRALIADVPGLPLAYPNVERADAMVKKYEESEHAVSPPQRWPPTVPRPAMEHAPPAAFAGQPLAIDLKLPHRYRVRLYYGPDGTMIENDTGHFVIPAEDVSLDSEIKYNFEILNNSGSGWFLPDPWTAAPYYSIRVQPAPPPKEDPGKAPSTRVSK